MSKTKKANQVKSSRSSYTKKLLAMSIATAFAGVAPTIVEASDISIYKNASVNAQATLMLLLDISGSMGEDSYYSDYGFNNDRNKARVYGPRRDQLICGAESGNRGVDNSLGYSRYYCRMHKNTLKENHYPSYWNINWPDAANGRMVTDPNTGCTLNNRDGYYYCYDRITRLKDALHDVLLGNPSKGIAPLGDDKVIGLATLGIKVAPYDKGAVLVPARRLDARVGNRTQREILWENSKDFYGVSWTPTARSYAEVVSYLMGTSTRGTHGSGYDLSNESTKANDKSHYESPSSLAASANTQCNGQGVYVLTDGAPFLGNTPSDTNEMMRAALGSKGGQFSCDDRNPGNMSNKWDCINKMSDALIDPTKNPKGLKFKTAVVGFGRDFYNFPKYDKKKSKAENLATVQGDADGDYAARWGINGEGGWYPGANSNDVVNSINEFIEALNVDIPPVTTGAPTIPRDALNTATFTDEAYYSQFDPTPSSTSQLWLGNLKKYNISGTGQLVDKNNQLVLDGNGVATTANYDLWSVGAPDQFQLKGGVWSKLKLGINADNTSQRKLITNRFYENNRYVGKGVLRQINPTDLSSSDYRNDPNRGYLMALLGRNVNPADPALNEAALKAAAELRQVGGVMHSSPLALTNKGKIGFANGKITYTDRQDYTLFGTLQGTLQVVDAKTGEEKFAFVPNEMVDKQKQAFLTPAASNGGTQSLFYGVDGPWAAYTEYVIDSNGALTVGVGKGVDQKGKQYLYGGLRMGGRSYYSLDLADMNSPKLKFHIDPATQKVYSTTNSDGKSFPQLQYMGQSWSKPTVGWVKWGGKDKLVMFVGGGYDAGGTDGDANQGGMKIPYAGYEDNNYDQTNNIGAGVYMFDAENGDLLWWASANAQSSSPVTANSGVISQRSTDMKYSVASEIRVIDRDGDKLIDNLYFGDLGGQMFRVDINNRATTLGAFSKAPVRLLNLHEANGTSPRFYDMPAFSVYDYEGNTFAVVSIGSGNRSQPLSAYDANSGYSNDAVYNVYDKDVAKPSLYTMANPTVKDITKAQLQEIDDAKRQSDTVLVAPYTTNGWYYQFASGKIQGEKVFGSPIVFNYRMFASTYDNSKEGIPGACGSGIVGQSETTGFCMPFGQCNVKITGQDFFNKIPLGAGIHTLTVRGDGSTFTSNQNGNGGNTQPDNDPTPIFGSSKDTCLTASQIGIYTPGTNKTNTLSQICLIPQRWYDKIESTDAKQ